MHHSLADVIIWKYPIACDSNIKVTDFPNGSNIVLQISYFLTVNLYMSYMHVQATLLSTVIVRCMYN